MLDILAISYKNIWPFKGNPISLFFHQGKYLIKAPIGTGKSFLFFDWPMYGLYKYNTRNILNNRSSEGFIKIIFTFENETRLIIRQITKAKVKESCTSLLYKIENFQLEKKGIIQKNEDIEDIIKKSWATIEKIEFKNETDLQQTFLSFLPPREVFVNTVFLMQDSDNIFELLPSERLTVLKNVFWLLGIDEAKDIIAEKKKEIMYKLKTYSDNTKYDNKIQLLIKNLINNHKELENKNIKEIVHILNEKNKQIYELTLIQEKITIQDLDISIFSLDKNLEIDTIIQKEKDEQKNIITQIENMEITIKWQKSKTDTKRQNLIFIQKENEELEKNIKEIEMKNFDEIKKQTEDLWKKLELIDKGLPYQKIINFIEVCKWKEDLKEYINSNIQSIEQVYSLIKQLIEKGKSLQENIKNNQLLIKNRELEQKANYEKILEKTKNLKEQETNIKNQLQDIEQHIKSFENNIEQQATFLCEKIGTNCPFIKIINKKTFDHLEEQKQTFIIKKQTLEQEVIKKHKEWEINQKEQEIIENTKYDEIIDNFKNNINQKEWTIEIIKTFFNEIERKKLEETYLWYIEIKKEKTNKEQLLKEGETLQKKKEDFIQKREKNKEIEKIIQTEIKENEQEITTLEKNKTAIESKIQNWYYEILLTAEKINNQCILLQRDIENTINEFKTLQREVELLKKQEKQINNLYTIFSKELLLLVLQDHLPILNDIINTYLAQIVDYQIALKLIKTTNEKLELEANIIDQQGEREIKSLSWWQKIILKLIWMLSISSYMRSPLLFLDETINNLDTETVSKVADLLENFIKQKQIKFYTVTHNQQIQDMQIRDEMLEITR